MSDQKKPKVDMEFAKQVAAFSGTPLEEVIDRSPEKMKRVEKMIQEMKEYSELRRRLKREDPEAYRKLREEDHKRMMNDPNYVGSGVWREGTPDDGKKDKNQD